MSAQMQGDSNGINNLISLHGFLHFSTCFVSSRMWWLIKDTAVWMSAFSPAPADCCHCMRKIDPLLCQDEFPDVGPTVTFSDIDNNVSLPMGEIKDDGKIMAVAGFTMEAESFVFRNDPFLYSDLHTTIITFGQTDQ